MAMTEQERINAEVQLKLSLQDAKFEFLMRELQQQREDIRATNARMGAKFDALGTKIDALTKQVNDTWKQTMIGVGGMIVALGGLLIAALK